MGWGWGAALIRGLQQEVHRAVGTGVLSEHHRVALQGHLCVFPDEEHSGISLCPTQQWGRGRVQVSWLRPLSSYVWLTCLWGSVGRGLKSVMAHGDTLSPSLALHTSQESGPQ